MTCNDAAKTEDETPESGLDTYLLQGRPIGDWTMGELRRLLPALHANSKVAEHLIEDQMALSKPLRRERSRPVLQKEFADAVEEYIRADDSEDTSKLREVILTLTGKLWNCPAQMPWALRSDLENLISFCDRYPNTFAQGARFMRYYINYQDEGN